jgi:hypothetical protein
LRPGDNNRATFSSILHEFLTQIPSKFFSKPSPPFPCVHTPS